MWNTLRSFTIAATALAFAFPVAAQQGPWSHAPGAASATFAPAPVHSTVVSATTTGPTTPIPGPTRASLAFPVATTSALVYAPSAEMRAPSSRNTALMIVGGAGLLVGAIIGGDEGTIIMLAGGGMGLWGLWRHLS